MARLWVDSETTIVPIAVLIFESITTFEVSTPSSFKLSKIFRPASSSPITQASETSIPKRAIVTAAVAAGPPKPWIVSLAITRSSALGYFSTRTIVSNVATPTARTLDIKPRLS